MLKLKIIDYQRVTSTNDVMKKLLGESELSEGTVILADYQSAGRGRGSHSWISEPGENLLMSLLLKPRIQVSDHFFINEFLSLAVIDSLKFFGVKAKIKWPNDIYFERQKLAGLLIENTIRRDIIYQSIVGLGLNINSTTFPEELPNPVSLLIATGKRHDRTLFIDRLAEDIARRYEQFQEKQWKELHQNFLQHSYALGQAIRYQDSGQLKSGMLEDIRPQGEIVIRTPENHLNRFLFDEIQLFP